LFLLFALPLAGQGLPIPSSQQESLLIGPGDLLHIQVYDTPQLDQHPRVDDAGDAPLLFLGSIRLAGDTPGQAAAAIQSQMISGGLMRHPQVSVIVEQYATQDVSVIGQVGKPGNYPIRTPRSILEVLSMAGGLTSLADRHVLVRRRNGKISESYFVANSPDPDTSIDFKVSPGDTIEVAKVNLVYVLGDVARPGGYPMASNDSPITLLETLAGAGSPNKTAILSGTRLIRRKNGNYTVLPIDIASIEQGKAPDVPLEADDVLFIPFSYTRNFLLNSSAIAASVAAAAIFVP
jgi:polysaccharide export outer membrane protein